VTWDFLDKFGIIIGLITGLVSVAIWIHLLRKESRYNELISISLAAPELAFKATLPGKIRRKNLTRAELQGMLGMLPMRVSGQRYQLDALNDGAFFDDLERAQIDRDIKEIEIVCQPQELEQFDEQRLAQVCEVNE
jgi:hypothetical protein